MQHHERLHGTTKYGLARFWRGFVDLVTVRFLMTYESRPSHLFSGVGLVSPALGALAMAYLGVEKLRGDPIGGRPLLIAAVVLALGGLQLVLFGLLAELLVYSRQREPRERPRAAPPRLLVVVSAAVVVVATALVLVGATRTGMTTDEPIHVMRLRNFFDTGWYALDWDYAGAGPGGDGTNTFVYAPVTMLLLHGWCVAWGVEGWGSVATTEQAYHLRHVGVALIGLVGLGAVAAAGRALLRHWRWGLVAAAVLAALPVWTGHQMFNVKDTPVATGHTLVTLGLLCSCALSAGPRLRLPRARCLAVGLVLALGTRPGMWSGLLGAPRGGGGRACSTCPSGVVWSWWAWASSARGARSPRWRSSRSTRSCSARRCARCRGPARRRPASWAGRRRTAGTSRATSPRTCPPCCCSSR